MMKYFKYLAIIFGVSLIITGCGQETIEDSSKTSKVSSENLESVSFKINGFT